MDKRKMSRRQFLTTSSAGSAFILAGASLPVPSPGAGQSTFDPFSEITLGKTGIRATLLGMGTGFSGYNRTSAITRAGVAEQMIRAAYDRGIRFFDCADSYGTHPFAAAALKGIPRDNYVLSSKMWVTAGGIPENDKADADVTVERFRKELTTDYIDIVQLHCMTDGTWPTQFKKQMDILENLKSKGIIRAHGVSVHSLDAMEAAAESSWVDVIHVRLNPFGDAMDKKDPSIILPVVQKMHKSGKGIIAMKLIGNGNFRNDPGKIDSSLDFVLNSGVADMIIVGFEKPGQVDDYISRIRGTVRKRM